MNIWKKSNSKKAVTRLRRNMSKAKQMYFKNSSWLFSSITKPEATMQLPFSLIGCFSQVSTADWSLFSSVHR
jgi:hypothetical protein